MPPRDDLYDLLGTALPILHEGDIIVITSKVLAIHQGRCVKIKSSAEKDTLILREAERFIPRREVPNGNLILTIKGNTLLPSSGIDESNGNGYAIPWPQNPSRSAKEICRWLKRKFHLHDLAVIITDSHSVPLRYGVVGISIGFFGLEPFLDYRGKPDIFGRKLKYTRTNIVDALAATAVLVMGEGKEQTPIVVLRGVRSIQFVNHPTHRALVVSPEKDIYSPLWKMFRKRR